MNSFTKNTKSYNLPLATLALVVPVLIPAPAYADVSDQIYNLKAESDVAHFFGNSLAMETGGVCVAAFKIRPDGSVSVSAYPYDLSTGLPLPNLSPSDGETQNHLGATIATDIGVVALAAWTDNDLGISSSPVYILDTATGNQIAKLLPNDGTDDDMFGFSLAIDNGVVAVGAYLQRNNNGDEIGAVYLFDWSTGNQIAKLVPSDGTAHAKFGYSLAIDNGIVVIGAHGDDNDTGAVYLFDVSTGNQIAKLHPNDGAPGDHFGWSVAINNDMVGVGSPGHDDSRRPDIGAVYLYDLSTSNQIAKLHPSDGSSNDHFGWSLAINNDIVGVGAPGHDTSDRPDIGAVYLYDLSTSNQIAKLLPDDILPVNHFGTAIAMDDSYTAIAASGGDYDYGPGSGSVHVFQLADEAPACPWDLDNSGSVDTSDLLELFAQWDTAGDADFDGSGNVDISDMLLLFANWGSCP